MRDNFIVSNRSNGVKIQVMNWIQMVLTIRPKRAGIFQP
jgi:hypothetical protein